MKCLSICAVLLLAVPVSGQAPDVKKAEAMVKASILDNAGDPDSVKFARWGPHDLTCKSALVPQDMDAMIWPLVPFQGFVKDGSGPCPLVRVRFRMKNDRGALAVVDLLFGLRKGKVVFAATNPYGDGWATRFAEKKAKK